MRTWTGVVAELPDLRKMFLWNMSGVKYHSSEQALVCFFSYRAAADGGDSGKKPLRLSLLISRSIGLRSCAEEKTPPGRRGIH